MKLKYATLIRNLLQNYHMQVKTIDKETFSIHSDGIQLMELNIQLAKCLEGITATAKFNNDKENFEELHRITLGVFAGSIPDENKVTDLVSLATSSVKAHGANLKTVI
ncbi:hypothetical protein ACV2MU_002584 [Klebsiella pneumoniae]